jgi:surfeit locus 1 family protein
MRRLIVPGLSTLVMLAILLGLGAWQVERLHWKHALLADIAAAESHPAVPLTATPAPFAKVFARGTVRYDLAALFGAEGRDLPSGPTMGAQLLVPLERPDGPTILVLLGWVPRLPDLPPAPASIEGYIRAPDQAGTFSAMDDVAGRRFYTLDPRAIAAAVRLGPVAPFTLVALGPTVPGQFPDPAHRLPRPPDNHLSYALTWFGLAGALVVIFLVYLRKVLRTP